MAARRLEMYISVIGASECSGELARTAYEVGREVAGRGHVLVCGGLGGVMDAAAHGASDGGGVSVGILPGADRRGASRWLAVSIPTNMDNARNAIVALSGDAIIAVGGGYGTLSEIAFGLKMGKPVVGIATWELESGPGGLPWLETAGSAGEAVAAAERLASRRGGRK